MNRPRLWILNVGLLGLALTLYACTAVHPPSGYLGDYSKLQKGEVLRQEYVEPGADLYGYEKVQVRPVVMKYFENAGGQFSQEDMDKLSSRLHSSLKDQLGKRYVVISDTASTDADTLVVEPALVYVKTPNRALNVATFWFIGFTFSKGAAAFEANLLDGGTGRTISQVAEKRKSAGSITDIKSILVGGWLRFASAEGIFKRWGKDLVKLTTPPKK